MNKSSRLRGALWTLLTALILASSAFLLWLSFQEYALWRGIADRIARDGSFESLTPASQSGLLWPVRIAGFVLIALAGWSFARPAAARRAMLGILRFPAWFARTLWADLRRLSSVFNPLPDSRAYRLALLAVIAAGVLVRLPFLDRAVIHDEAYTVETWASGSLRYAVEDYHLPNNHIFHTLLVRVVFNTLGSQPWMVRLPAFLAGALLIPLGYAFARRLYGQPAGILAAGLIAASPILADYSTNARGYTLFMLFSLLVFWLAAGLLRRKNLAGWVLLILSAGLGFWTVPMMLYPFGGACAWIFLSALDDREAARAYGGPWGLIKYLFVAGVSSGLLALLLYAPVLRSSGADALFNNQFVASLPWTDFWPTLFQSRLPETWGEWARGWGLPLALLLAAGVLASLVVHRRESAYRVHLLPAILLFVVLVLLYQHPNPWPRVWSYLYPLGYVWAAAGLLGVLKLLRLGRMQRWLLPSASAALVLAGLLISGSRALRECPAFNCPVGEEESVVLYLKPLLKETDLVLVESPSDAPVWYYFRQNGLSKDLFRKDHAFFRAFLLLRPAEGQTAEQLIAYRGPEAAFFNFDTLRPLMDFGGLQIVEIQAYPDLIRKEYHID